MERAYQPFPTKISSSERIVGAVRALEALERVAARILQAERLPEGLRKVV